MIRRALPTLALALAACASGPRRPAYDRSLGQYRETEQVEPSGHAQSGIISYYGDEFHGRKTASGVLFDKHAFTAAHRSLPFKTKVRVTNLENGKSVVVEITDRGPFVKGRILDVSQAAAREIGLIGKGTVRGRITVL